MTQEVGKSPEEAFVSLKMPIRFHHIQSVVHEACILLNFCPRTYLNINKNASAHYIGTLNESIGHIDFSMPNSLPFNTSSFGSVICPMDDPDIERAEKQKY